MNAFRKTTIQITSWLVIGAIGYFFYVSLHDNWDKVKDISIDFSLWSATGIFFFVLAVVISGVLWGKILSVLTGNHISMPDAIRVHSASWLLKYIPGQIGAYLNKIAWGARRDINKKTISTSFIYENVLMVFAGVALSTPVLVLFTDKLGEGLSLLLPVLIILPMSVVLWPKFFYSLLNFIFSKLKRKLFKKTDFLSFRQLITYQVGYFIPRVLNGIGFVFIAISIFPVTPSMYIGLAAIYILASIVGLLAIFVPGGIGVREAVIVLFASVYLPIEQAIVLALLTRLYATVADVGVAAVYVVLNKGKLRQV